MTKESDLEISYKEIWNSLWMAFKIMADNGGKPIEPYAAQEVMELMEKTFMGPKANV